MRSIFTALLLVLFLNFGFSQLSITDLQSDYLFNFDSYDGSGFSASPTSGQIPIHLK